MIPIVGIPCPSCGSNQTAVRESVKRPASVRRRRHCIKCGQVFHTREIPEAEIPTVAALEALRDRAITISKLIDRVLKGIR